MSLASSPPARSTARSGTAARRTFLLELIAVALVYYGAGRLGLELASVTRQISVVWLDTGIALALLVLRGRRLWPAIIVGAFAANVTNDTPVLMAGFLTWLLAGFLLGGLFRMFMVLNSTFTINSLCHMVGAQPYSKKDSSRDSWLVSFVSFGEGYHNFHHAYARDYRNGPQWYNFDPSKWIIYTLSLIGLARNLRRNDPTVG